MSNSSIELYFDGANEAQILARYREGLAQGFTTNPTLMHQAGIKDYERFARKILSQVKDLPFSFEVFSDEIEEMHIQAKKIASWGKNVFVKIPITNTKSVPTLPLIRACLDDKIKVNVTAILSEDQIIGLREILKPNDHIIVSIFAGRIADTGIDPVPLMRRTVQAYKNIPHAKVLWASPREVLNVYQAGECGCHIITMTDGLFDKLKLKNKDLAEYSLETVKMFYRDAQSAGFSL